MAKVVDQNIPPELLPLYRTALGEERPDSGVRKRYPFRVPTVQTEVGHPTQKQKTQRGRFNFAIQKFSATPWAVRQRWYASMPPWGSFLWYYNYFILSGLMGGHFVNSGELGVIKSIQVIKEEVPTTGGKAFAISAVDPDKTVVMMYGNSYISDKIQRGYNTVNQGSFVDCALSPNIDTDIAEVKLQGEVGGMEIIEGTGYGDWAAPYIDTLSVSNLRVRLPGSSYYSSCIFSWEIIEHKAQTIYPVYVSIAAEVVNIDWAKVPSIPADVSITVIEYI